jgi:hypothetical protein
MAPSLSLSVTRRRSWSIASIFAVSSTPSVWVTGFWARATVALAVKTASTANSLFMA